MVLLRGKRFPWEWELSEAELTEPATDPPSGGILAGRRILITGASRGIGKAAALAAAREGADLAIAYHTEEDRAQAVADEVRALGREAQIFAGDVSNFAEAQAMVRRAERDLGGIDGLVNNAGVMPQSPFLECSEEEWNLVLRTDLTAAFACSQAAIPGMLARGRGSIVMIASRLGQIGFAGVAHYSAAKAGMIALAKSISREFGTQGIRANTVAPGVTITDMGSQVTDGEVGRKRMAEMPLGRFGLPEEVADSIVFLLSDKSALYLGQTLNPNSGGFMP